VQRRHVQILNVVCRRRCARLLFHVHLLLTSIHHLQSLRHRVVVAAAAAAATAVVVVVVVAAAAAAAAAAVAVRDIGFIRVMVCPTSVAQVLCVRPVNVVN
jgi:hypothetical protein